MIVDKLEPNLGEVVITSYEGDFDEEGFFDGKGEAILDNECTYTGYFKHGMFQGKGVFTWPNGVKYEGEFERGVIHGKGAYSWYDGSTYQGRVEDGKRNGPGKFQASSGQAYDGEWRAGKRHGHGKIVYNDTKTSHYTGQWVENLRHGYGTMKYASGNTYEGEWEGDKKCGLGVMSWRDVDEVYTGEWKDDQPHGFGEHIWGEGGNKILKKQMCNMYRGEFLSGKRHGLGTFFYMNGSQYTGYWENDQKHGEGVFIQQDGRIVAGEYEENRFLSTNMDASVQVPRATDDVNPQYVLNIDDVLLRYPKIQLAGQPQTDQNQTKELERLLLKYNTYVKQAYRRYTDFAVTRRTREATAAAAAMKANVKVGAMKGSAAVTGAEVESAISNRERAKNAICTARNFQKRLSCCTVEQFLRFMREAGFIGPFLMSIDIKAHLKEMRSNHNIVSSHVLFESAKRMWAHRHPADLIEPPPPLMMPPGYAQAAATLAPQPPGATKAPMSAAAKKKQKSPEEIAAILAQAEAMQAVHAQATEEYQIKIDQQNKEREILMLQDLQGGVFTQLKLASVLDSYATTVEVSSDPDFAVMSAQPILEREFVEMMIRCVASFSCRREFAAGRLPSLYHSVYEALGKHLQPLTNDWVAGTPPFYQAFYHDAVQGALYGSTHVTVSKKPTVSSKEAATVKAANAAGEDGSAPVAPAEAAPLAVTALERLWKQVVDNSLKSDEFSSQLAMDSSGVNASNPRGSSVEVRNVISLLLDSAGSLVSSAASPETLFRIFNCLPDGSQDFSVSVTRIDFDDFVDMMCRLIASEFWVFGQAPAAVAEQEGPATDAAPAPEDASAAGAPTDEAKIESKSADDIGSAVPTTDEGADQADAAPDQAEKVSSPMPLHKLLADRLGCFAANYKIEANGNML